MSRHRNRNKRRKRRVEQTRFQRAHARHHMLRGRRRGRAKRPGISSDSNSTMRYLLCSVMRVVLKI